MSDGERDDSDTDVATSSTELDEPPALQADEVYCTSCGEPIKEKAAVCPQCGVPQSVEDEIDGMSRQQLSDVGIPPEKAYQLRKLAQKNMGIVDLVGLTVSPLAYLMLGKWGWAVVNVLTLNYLLTGFLVVPIHTSIIIYRARKELDTHGVEW